MAPHLVGASHVAGSQNFPSHGSNTVEVERAAQMLRAMSASGQSASADAGAQAQHAAAMARASAAAQMLAAAQSCASPCAAGLGAQSSGVYPLGGHPVTGRDMSNLYAGCCSAGAQTHSLMHSPAARIEDGTVEAMARMRHAQLVQEAAQQSVGLSTASLLE